MKKALAFASAFFNDVFRCAEHDEMMCPSDMMCASHMKVTTAEHSASFYCEAVKHHCERNVQHHLSKTNIIFQLKDDNFRMKQVIDELGFSPI